MSAGERRVVVTGIGVVSCLGLDVDAHWQRLVAGESGVSRLEGAIADVVPIRLQARVDREQVQHRVHNRMLRKLLLPSGTFATAAAGEALADAGVLGDETRLDSCGLYFGSVTYELPARTFEPALRASFDAEARFDVTRFARIGMSLVDPLLIVKGLPNAAPCGIAIEHGIRGPNASVTDGVTSGLQAVAAGWDAVRHGTTDLALVGGADSLLLDEQFLAHHVAGHLLEGDEQPWHGARPFDAERAGYVLGEGAAVCVLEEARHARERGARSYGEILGVAEHTCAPPDEEGRGLTSAALAAAREPGVSDIELVFGNGFGTVTDDRREMRATRAVRQSPSPVRLTAATGALGMTGAASGAFSLVHALLWLARGVVPATVGCGQRDPGHEVIVPAHAEPLVLARALVWSTDGFRNVAAIVGAAA